MTKRMSGTVLWWNEKLAYGFIRGDDGIEDFIHYKNINEKGFKNLFRGQRVSYIRGTGIKGTNALNLHYERSFIE